MARPSMHNAKEIGDMLLEVTLRKDDDDLGVEGDKILLNFSNVVAISGEANEKAVVHLDVSDLGKFRKVFIKEKYGHWALLKLNV